MDDLISRESVIDKLKREEKIFYSPAGLKYLIGAVRDLPSAQPEKRTENAQKTRACDLISRQAAIDALCDDYCSGHHDCKRYPKCENLRAIQKLPSAQQWIPCSERLPEEEVEVFVYLFDRPSPYIAWISKDGKWHTEDFTLEVDENPATWMPLPEPFKGEQE